MFSTDSKTSKEVKLRMPDQSLTLHSSPSMKDQFMFILLMHNTFHEINQKCKQTVCRSLKTNTFRVEPIAVSLFSYMNKRKVNCR